jgi:membrane-associated phospholipid phosphatase
MKWTLSHAWAWKPLYIIYCLLFPVIILAWVTEQNGQLLRALLAGGIGCWFFYWLFPAIGPGWYDWLHPAAVAPAPRNCMPSMHMAWALLVAVNARHWGLKITFSIYAAMMAFATLGLGEHYFIDLLAAVPYAIPRLGKEFRKDR